MEQLQHTGPHASMQRNYRTRKVLSSLIIIIIHLIPLCCLQSITHLRAS